MSAENEFATRPSPKHLHCEQEPDALTRLQDAVDSGELERVDSSFVARGASMAAREIARVSSNSIIGANVHYDTAESSSGLRRLAGEVGVTRHFVEVFNSQFVNKDSYLLELPVY